MKSDLESSKYDQILAVLETQSKALPPRVLRFLNYPHKSELSAYHYGSGDLLHRPQDYLFLPEIFSAKKHLYAETVSFLIFGIFVLSFLTMVLAALLNISSLIIVAGIIAIFYLALMAFKLYVVHQSFEYEWDNITKEEIDGLRDEELPTYTIVVPLLKEAEVMDQIIDAMTNIDYPEDKLEVLVTLERYDYETIHALERVEKPSYIKPLILPDTNPKTKPKALNVAFLESTGEYLVIYDAEIIPDPDQLKKAVIAYRKNKDLGFVQTRLDHYNADQNILTKLFNAEFSFHYDLFLPGLIKLGLPIPLSGHSVHFKREALEKIGAWDPYNVTEDCDLGMRLHRAGYKTCIIDSISKEEATSTTKAWIHQRTRWMKGFIQTSIVHLRHPIRLANELGGWKNFFSFILTVPGMVFINFINLFTWTLFIAWQTTRSPAIKELYPLPVLYISGIAFIIGIFAFTYLNLIGAYNRNRFSFVKYSLLSPLYWMLQAYASTRALIQIFRNPHAWEKTTHGTHLRKAKVETKPIESWIHS